MTRTVAIIGGGITGITAALTAAASGDDVHLFEAAPQLGGKIAEAELAGKTIPTGPDAFLARRPEVTDLATSLGLESSLISPVARSARIYRDGTLHPLPPNVLGVPATADLSPGLLSAEGIERLAQDLDAPDDRPDGDESVGDMVRRRLGDEVLEFVVDPLLGGINAGDSDRLSLRSGVPQLDALRQRDPSLVRAGAATLAAAPSNPPPVFHSIDGGLNRLIDAAQQQLIERGVTLHLGSEANIEQTGESWNIVWADSMIAADHVVITTAAPAASKMLQTADPATAELLAEIDYSSVALLVLILPGDTIDIDRAISGVLVPRLCGLGVTAVSFASHKWPSLGDDGSQVVRVSVGRRTNIGWQELTDEDLTTMVSDDLATIFDTAIPEGPTHITRWMKSLPQYDVDHYGLIARIDQSLQTRPGLTLTGAWRNGLGLPACVAAGIDAVTSA